MKKLSVLIIISPLIFTLNACTPLIVAGTVAGGGAYVASDRRSPKMMLDDKKIEIQLTDEIYSNDKYDKSLHISISSYNKTVLITGEAPSEEIKQEIGERVFLLLPVKKVINNISVKPRLSGSAQRYDAWLTSKVKSHLVFKKGPATHTKVISSDGVVYLLGLVNNDEAEKIVRIANEVEGAKKVIPLFESTNGTLANELSAESHVMQAKQKKVEPEIDPLDEEDNISVQPYVIQPPIKLSND